MSIITLITDFGTADWFAGTLKGVILSIAPRVTVVDITHAIPGGDVRAGAFALAASCRFFPRGTVHVAIVDPGVGSKRAGIAVRTSDYFFVGPDNGVLSWALASEKVRSIRRLENQKHFLRPVSSTFHGRDIFAPVAARLSAGLPFGELGPEQTELVRLPWPAVRQRGDEIAGEIVHVDCFGNAITNIDHKALARFDRTRCSIFLPGRATIGLKRFYQEIPKGRGAGIISSSGFLEIAVNRGSAAKKFTLKAGDKVVVRAS